jgi:hypothetical protein
MAKRLQLFNQEVKRIMKTKILALLFLGATSMFAAHWSVGIGVGVGGYPAGGYYVAAPPPPPVYYAPPPAPYPGYAWVGGYYYPVGARWAWRGGYWARPPYAGAVWVAPRYHGNHYYAGYWRHR